MTVKSFVKLFVPPIIFKIKSRLSLRKKNAGAPFVSTVGDVKKNAGALVVIGNGPSLKDTLEKNMDKLKSYDCMVVNHFCETDYYKELKPKYYLLADPAFFGKIDTYAEWLQEKIRKFIDVFVKSTNWDVDLIVPSCAANSEFINLCEGNKYVHVFYYNYFDTRSYNESERFALWDKNLLSVPSQTCLNTCLWLGIFLRYKEVYLVGADTSWMELLHVDQETNEVYAIDSHFYGARKKVVYKDLDDKTPSKLYEQLDSISNVFKLYWELKSYADYAGVKVYNASEYSLIDAFERKKL